MVRFKDHQITPEHVYFNRRSLIAGAGAALLAPSLRAESLEPTRYKAITSYNNYYEFSTDKNAVASLAQQMTIKPWQIEISGEFEKTGTFDLNDAIGGLPVESRVYRLRCVEAWSMVVPWNGFELRKLLERFGVKSSAKFIGFETLYRPEEMPGTKFPVLDWPYREGLRIDEAMHPLTIIATGIYDKPLLKQNGAPLRLVVPWKYGFKSIKSITRITASTKMPYATWHESNPREYGFYANVNPQVDHPRWSQSSERVVGAGAFAGRRKTEIFNGYDEVASLYAGMDLKKNF